ncbi:hypothetical protein ACC675_37570, partial [Rhizobium ruizarguesonis]
MPHDTPLISTIVGGLLLAFIFGAFAHRLDDADFGQIRRKILIRHITWRMWPDEHPSDQITDER